MSGIRSILDWREFFSQIRSKGIILSFLLAFGIWLYVSLNGNYSTFIEVPVKIITNEDQAIESTVPSKILVEAKGRGWDLLYLKYVQKRFECKIDISNITQTGTSIEITHSKILQSLTSLEQIEIKNTNPDFFEIKLGKVASKDVDVYPNFEIETRNGFIQVGEIELSPEQINIKGYEKIIKNINQIPTEKTVLVDVFKNVRGRVGILDTLSQMLKITPKSVNYKIEIQQKCNLEIPQVPIEVEGGQLEVNNKLNPTRITVIVEGGVDEIARIMPGDVRAVVSYKDVINDSTGIIIPKIILPKNIKLLKTNPQFIYHQTYKSGNL